MTTPKEPLENPGPASAQKRPASMGELFAALSSQVTTLVSGEIELNKVKAKNYIRKLGAGAVFLTLAGIFSLYLLAWVFHSIELALALALPAWAASLITTALLLFIVAFLVMVGTALLSKRKSSVPDPKAGINDSIDAFKKGLGK